MTRWEPDAAGRLLKAAIDLFDEQGYEATTVAEIAERAGLTKRTFFRYFSDKREVLFGGSDEFERTWLDGIAAAPENADAMAAVAAAYGPVTELFADRHPFASVRARIIAANADLQERELIKLNKLAEAIKNTLLQRGVSENEAILAAHAGVTVFRVAFGRWVRQDDATMLRQMLDESLAELRSVTAAAPQAASA